MIKNIITSVLTSALVALFVVVAVGGNNSSAPTEGPASGAAGTRFPNGISVGPASASPTIISGNWTGTCNAAIATLPVIASSTATATCTVTGVAAGDKVFVSLPGTSSYSIWGGFDVGGATASTNTITFQYFNNTGVATSSFILATTSVQYWIVR